MMGIAKSWRIESSGTVTLGSCTTRSVTLLLWACALWAIVAGWVSGSECACVPVGILVGEVVDAVRVPHVVEGVTKFPNLLSISPRMPGLYLRVW